MAHLDLQRTALGSMGFEPQGCARLFRATQLQKATVQQQLVPLCGRSDSTYAVIRPEAYGRNPQETHDSPLSEAEAPSSKTAPSKTHKKNHPGVSAFSVLLQELPQAARHPHGEAQHVGSRQHHLPIDLHRPLL